VKIIKILWMEGSRKGTVGYCTKMDIKNSPQTLMLLEDLEIILATDIWSGKVVVLGESDNPPKRILDAFEDLQRKLHGESKPS